MRTYAVVREAVREARARGEAVDPDALECEAAAALHALANIVVTESMWMRLERTYGVT